MFSAPAPAPSGTIPCSDWARLIQGDQEPEWRVVRKGQCPTKLCHPPVEGGFQLVMEFYDKCVRGDIRAKISLRHWTPSTLLGFTGSSVTSQRGERHLCLLVTLSVLLADVGAGCKVPHRVHAHCRAAGVPTGASLPPKEAPRGSQIFGGTLQTEKVLRWRHESTRRGLLQVIFVHVDPQSRNVEKRWLQTFHPS